jgi:hypothetical protein
MTKKSICKKSTKQRKLEPNQAKNHRFTTGSAGKGPKARRKVGSIVTHPTVKADTNLVEDPTERKENTHHVDQPPAHVKRRVKENLGAKNQKKERKNETNRNKIEIFD